MPDSSSFTSEVQTLIKEAMASGQYENVNQLLWVALDLLRQWEHDDDWPAIKEALDAVESGRDSGRPAEEVFEELRQLHASSTSEPSTQPHDARDNAPTSGRHNLMSMYITSEDGATALLATAINPEVGHRIQQNLWNGFSRLLREHGISLPEGSRPSIVRQQYLNMDLVMVWEDWIFVLENKINSASITRNQLNRYYRVATKSLAGGTFLDAPNLSKCRVGIVYLTPTQHSGSIEFASTTVDEERGDRKVHLGWPTVLELLYATLKDSNQLDPFAIILRDGCELIGESLKRSKETKTPASPERDATRSFLDRVQERVTNALRSEPDLKLSRWKDPRGDEFYGWIGGKEGNVYLRVDADGTDLTREPQAVVHAQFRFWATVKNRRTYSHLFSDSTATEWAARLGLEASQLEMLEDRRGVELDSVFQGTPSELAEDFAARFCRFLQVFRPLMEGRSDLPSP